MEINRIQHEFASTFDLVRSLHSRRLDTIDPMIVEMLGKPRFLKDYGTIRFDMGRQIGKTYFISTRSSRWDIILNLNMSHVKAMVDESPWMKGRVISHRQIEAGLILEKFQLKGPFDTVWVDEASFMLKMMPEMEFYERIVELFDPRQVILFG